MEVTWLSHSCFELEDSMDILVDPYLEGNSLSPRSLCDTEVVIMDVGETIEC